MFAFIYTLISVVSAVADTEGESDSYTEFITLIFFFL